MLPQEEDQVTGIFAVNCADPIACIAAVAGVMVIGDVTVTFAVAVWPVPFVAVALIVQEPAASGAVYKPVASTLPQVAVQLAGTLGVNCCCAPSLTVGLVGEMVKVGGVPMVSAAVAVYAGPVDAVAVMVQVLFLGADAVNSPLLGSMLPHEAVQVTGGVFTVNCCVSPCGVVILAGVIANGDVMVAVDDAVLLLP